MHWMLVFCAKWAQQQQQQQKRQQCFKSKKKTIRFKKERRKRKSLHVHTQIFMIVCLFAVAFSCWFHSSGTCYTKCIDASCTLVKNIKANLPGKPVIRAKMMCLDMWAKWCVCHGTLVAICKSVCVPKVVVMLHKSKKADSPRLQHKINIEYILIFGFRKENN